MRVLLLALLVLLGGCADNDEGPRPVPASTSWIGQPEQAEDTELFMKVFTSEDECRAALGPEKAEACRPVMDRATGQVRLAFQTLDNSTMTPYPLPLQQEHVQVLHNKRPVKEGQKSGYELQSHDPRRAGQLFILLIDGSGSMYENDNEQIDKLYKALMNRKVTDAFYPGDVPTGVVLLRFTSRVKGLDGGAPQVLEDKESYRGMVHYKLKSGERGFTHLYEAVAYAAGPLMDEPAIKEWLRLHQAEPTIVALTDGFNNEKGSDRCRDNVPRLQALLEEVEIARNQPLGLRPTIFTVGLGEPIRPRFEEVPRGRVSARDLCARFANEIINADLERRGIDNVSLKWIAARGGGESFVSNNPRGLAEVFQEAAAVRYLWYTALYKVDPFYHRQGFESRIRLTSYANAEAAVEVHPSSWLDAPTGERRSGERWAEPTPMRHTFALGMPLVGGLILIAFLGPASFNARRAVTRRARGGPKGGPAGAPDASVAEQTPPAADGTAPEPPG